MKTSDKKAVEEYLKKLELIKSGAGDTGDETPEERHRRIDKARNDIAYFVTYYLPHYATSTSAPFHLSFARKVMKHKTCNYLVRWGRGLAKSVWCDVIIPLWLWVNGDIMYMLLVGNNLDKAKILLSDLQAEFEANSRLINDYGQQINGGSWQDGYFRTASGFVAKALGMGQSPRGLRMKNRRPDYIVADDLDDRETVKNPKRTREFAVWIERDLIPTMDGPRRRFLMPNNRFAPVTIQSVLEERHPKWHVNRVDAYDPASYRPAWPAKYSEEYYRQMEIDIGRPAALAEYNNTPHIEGSIFHNEDIVFDHIPPFKRFTSIVGHWDVAYSDSKTADCNAVRVWGLCDGRFWLVGSFVRQCKMKAAIRYMAEFTLSLPPGVRVRWQFESQFWNGEVERNIREVEDEFDIDLRLRKVALPHENKYDRIVSTQPYYQNRRIVYSRALMADNDTLEGIAQLLGIEPGYKTHDDAPDADERCLAELSKHLRRAKRRNTVSTGSRHLNDSRKYQ